MEETGTRMPNKTFGLTKSADFLHKVEWELRRLRDISPGKLPDYSYQAMNCAVSLWHMADWIRPELSTASRELLGDDAGPKMTKFHTYLQAASDELLVCRNLADAFKHRCIDHKPHPTIGTEVLNVSIHPDGEIEIQWPITNGQEHLSIVEVFEGALTYWRNFMIEHDLGLQPARKWDLLESTPDD